MSRIKDLKEKYPVLGMSVADVLEMLDPTEKNKYLPMMGKVINNHIDSRAQRDSLATFQEMMTSYKFPEAIVKETPHTHLYFIYSIISDLIGSSNPEILVNFMELNERGLIIDNDLQNYKTIDELQDAISLAQLKLVDKEMASQIIRVFEDDNWIVLRPLTFAASCKYGAATKWCTPATSEPQHFHRYWSRGCLIYILNKQTGYKVATQKYYDDSDRSTLWNAADREVNWADVDVPGYVFEKVRDEINKNISNRDLCDTELKEKVLMECLGKKQEVQEFRLQWNQPEQYPLELDHNPQQRLDELIRNALTGQLVDAVQGIAIGNYEEEVEEDRMPTQQEHDDLTAAALPSTDRQVDQYWQEVRGYIQVESAE